MKILEILSDPKKIDTLRIIEQPTSILSPLEISVETGLDIEEVENILKELENASLVRQKAGYYSITLAGMRKMKSIRKMR